MVIAFVVNFLNFGTDKAGLRLKRAEQVAAVKLMMKIEDYAKQYKMVKLVLEKIFQVISVVIFHTTICFG